LFGVRPPAQDLAVACWSMPLQRRELPVGHCFDSTAPLDLSFVLFMKLPDSAIIPIALLVASAFAGINDLPSLWADPS
jgi:hypothetical protein